MFSITLSDKLNKQNSHTNKTLMSIERLADVLIASRCGTHSLGLVYEFLLKAHVSPGFPISGARHNRARKRSSRKDCRLFLGRTRSLAPDYRRRVRLVGREIRPPDR